MRLQVSVTNSKFNSGNFVTRSLSVSYPIKPLSLTLCYLMQLLVISRMRADL